MIVIAADDKHRLALVDALRCFAALWVVFFHLSEGQHVPTLMVAIPRWLKAIVFDAGHLGVPIFFVLSGIVMAATTFRVPMTTGNAVNFVIRRLVRLAPSYYIAVTLGVAIICVKHFSGQNDIEVPSVKNVIGHLLFLQGILGIENILTVFWTLCIEVQFYIAFAVLLWLADKISVDDVSQTSSIVMWASALLALFWPTELIHALGWQGGFIDFWFSFMAGVLCGQTVTGNRQSRYVAIGYCFLVFVIGIFFSSSFAISVGLTGLLFCFLVNASFADGFLSSHPVQKLSMISYSLYLFHSPVTGVFMRFFRSFIPTGLTTDMLAVILTVAVCILCSTIAYRFIECPAIAWSRRIKFKTYNAAVVLNPMES